MSALPLVVTPGDPHGIGPEVVGKALRQWTGPVVVVGDRAALAPWCDRLVPVDRIRPVPDGVAILDPGDDEAPVEAASIALGVRACLAGEAAALVTGPIHKARLARRGFPHPGHTEYLAALCGVERPVMAFVGGQVRVSLVTVHVPLRDVPGRVTEELVLHTLRRSHEALRDRLGRGAGRIVACGLNPPAGDEGLLGTEDRDVVAPAVARAVAEGIPAEGPVSAEAAFRAAVRGEADWVVAMYHDQGLAPLKALEFAANRVPGLGERSVNWTLGLPIVRVGVDHGTAYDIAGRGVADEGSLLAALRLGERLGAT
ncbi:MAG: 4-hydroxythreonine-4-phosphate dehydrogenase PdxA [Myxococcota bacterium]